jgi:hypothetical protein
VMAADANTDTVRPWMSAPRVEQALAHWKEYYGAIFDQLNPAPSGAGPAIPKNFFGGFEVTIDSNRSITVVPSFSSSDPIERAYAEKVTKILKAMAGSDQLAFPENVSSVKFKIDANGHSNDFKLWSWDHSLTTDARK